jgi:coenzyme F420-0:L-glutamate ligase/coenzyme F420-1:gamma-L-glutamate ligase
LTGCADRTGLTGCADRTSLTPAAQKRGAARQLLLTALPGMPLVKPGDDVAGLIQLGLQVADLALEDGDVVVVAQKIISKAEDRYVNLADVSPGPRAAELARQVDKDPRLVELILAQSREPLRHRPGVLIVEHQLGYVHANAGIDRSNVEGGDDTVLLLPLDPDASAAALRAQLAVNCAAQIAVIINDSAGRAWREGAVGFALGTAGFEPLVDLVGKCDLLGRAMEVTSVAVADELAAAASLLMGQSDEGAPVVIIRGAQWLASEAGSRALIRDRDRDLFR